MVSTVGIIANPASGRDIRRLVARASVFDNHEKTNILQRALLALDKIGVDRVSIMPDSYSLGERALDGLDLGSLSVDVLEMPVTTTAGDSTAAAALLREMGAGVMIVLGGDGTNRAVAKACGDVPIVPVSTGTNNVFPMMVEGTVAGLAAGLLATGTVDPDEVAYIAKRLEVWRDGELLDIALIDVATSTDLWVGARAMWDLGRVREIILTRAEPGCIGLSAVGGCFETVDSRDGRGMYLVIGPGGAEVLAPVGPGLVSRIAVREQRILSVGDGVPLSPGATMIALDGEREIEVRDTRGLTVRLSRNGPRVVDVRLCMEEAPGGALSGRSHFLPEEFTDGSGDYHAEARPDDERGGCGQVDEA